MNFQIEDGTGGGSKAKVTQDNLLRVAARTKKQVRAVTEVEGKVWSINFEDVDPAGADDYFFYIKNTGTEHLEVLDITMASTVAGRAQVRFVTGIAVGGSAIAPVSRNSLFSIIPTAITESGVDITGLTNAGTLFYMWFDTVNRGEKLAPDSSMLIEPGGALAILWEEASGILTGTITLVDDSATDID